MSELNIREIVEKWAGQEGDVIKVEDLVFELEQLVNPHHNEIIHLQVQLRQAQEVIESLKV